MMMNISSIPLEQISRAANESDFLGIVSLPSLGPGDSLDLMFGFADRAQRVPNNVKTRFAVASGSKIFK